MRKWPVVTILLALLSSGCAHHVVFSDQIAEGASQPVHDGPIRLYVDMHGDLYPDRVLAVDGALLAREETLQDAMRATPQPGCGGPLPAEEQALCAAAAADSDTADARWRAAQDRMWMRAAARIKDRLGPGVARRPILLLLHGFNVVDARRNLKLARDALDPFMAGQDPLVVELHWDGYTSVLNQAWASSQYSGPLVGLQLRRLLNALPADQPYRVLTHSSGAFVIASALGDATAALGRAQEARTRPRKYAYPYKTYAANAASRDPGNPLRVPSLSDIRVGMMVAATSPDTFTGTSRFPGGILTTGTHLIFGVNPHDQTIRKGARLEQLSSLGATSMGSRFDIVCDVARSLKNTPHNAQVEVLLLSDAEDESNRGILGMLQAHGMDVYLGRQRFRSLAARLFDTGPAAASDAYACPSAAVVGG